MAMLVTVEQAAEHLKIDSDQIEFERVGLTLKIKGASAAVLNYLEMTIDDFGDSDSDGREIAEDIQAATLLLVGDFHRHRDTESPAYGDALLPPCIRALLYPLKTWGLESV